MNEFGSGINTGGAFSMGSGIQPTIALQGANTGGYAMPMMMGGCGGFGGFGGDGIWAILLLALLGRGNGFGGNDNNDCTVPVMANQNLNGRFDALSDQITCGDNSILSSISQNAIVDAVRSVDANVCAGFLQTQKGFGDTNAALQAGFGQSRLDACNGFNAIGTKVDEAKFQTALGFERTNANIMECLTEAA